MFDNNKISVLLPTRGRRFLAERFLISAIQLSKSPKEIEFIIYVDDDDIDSQSINVENAECRIVVGARCTMGKSNTLCLVESTGSIIVLANDDVIIRTEGWDEKIRLLHRSFKDQIYLAYPNDLNKGKSLSAFPIMSRKTCALLAQPFPTIYKGAFIDTHLMEIFIRLKNLGVNRIRYMEDVVFEHLHFRAGKAKVDQTYKDRARFADDMVFLSLNNSRKEMAKFLSDVINQKLPRNSKFKYMEPTIISRPKSISSMLVFLANLYYSDFDLKSRMRIKNFFYYAVRWLASSVKPLK